MLRRPRSVAITSSHRRAHCSTLLAALLTVGMLTSCATDDGKKLRAPTGTAPPTSTTTTTTIPGATPVTAATSANDIATSDEQFFQLTVGDPPMTTFDRMYTCDGEDISPPMSWSGVPADAVALALVVSDDSADDFVHWVMVNIEPNDLTLESNFTPIGAVEAINHFGQTQWNGPCAAVGSGVHEYRFRLVASTRRISVPEPAGADAVIELIDANQLRSVSTIVTYDR